MKKKFLMILISFVSVFCYSFEVSEYQNILNAALLDDFNSACYIFYELEDNSLKCYKINKFGESLENNLFCLTNELKINSKIYSEKENFTEAICFNGINNENQFIYFIVTSVFLNDILEVAIPVETEFVIEKFFIQNNKDLVLFYRENSKLYRLELNIVTKDYSIKSCFSNIEIEDIDIIKAPDKKSYYGTIAYNEKYASFYLDVNGEYKLDVLFENVNGSLYKSKVENGIISYCNGLFVCSFFDGENKKFNNIYFNKGIGLSEIKNICSNSNGFNVIIRTPNELKSINFDITSAAIDEITLLQYDKIPFIYIDENNFISNGLSMFIKNEGVFSYVNNEWKKIEEYKNIEPYLTDELLDISYESERNIQLLNGVNKINNKYEVYVSFDKKRFIPLLNNSNSETYDFLMRSYYISDNYIYYLAQKNDIVYLETKVDSYEK